MKQSVSPGRRLIRLTAGFTLLCFTATSVSFAEPVRLSSAVSPKEFVLPAAIELPEDLGKIETQLLRKDSPKPLIIHIQDAHSVLDAQSSIRKITHYFEKNYGISLVAVEGARGEWDTTLLKTFPDKWSRDKVLNGYFNRGEMTGAEMAAVQNESQAVYHGIEDWPLYEENLLAYLQASEKKEEMLQFLHGVSQQWDAERRKIYSPKLEALHEKREAFENASSKLPELLEFISAKHEDAKSLENYSQLKILLKALREEKARKPEALDKSVRGLADSFKAKYLARLNPEMQKEFEEKLQSFKTGQADAASFLSYLTALGRENGFRSQLNREMQSALKNSGLFSQMKGGKVFEELETYLSELENRLAKTDAQREWSEKYRKLRILKDLVSLELSRPQLERYQKAPEAYLNFLGEKRESAAPALQFYKLALERDGALHRNLEKILEKNKAKAVLVLAGGFHAPGLESFARESGFSFCSVLPAMSSVKGAEDYEKLMHGQVSWRGPVETSLYDTFMKHAVTQLTNSQNPSERSRVLKHWRDEIIRRLAAEGRLDRASRYTHYVDGLGAAAPASREEILKAIDDVIVKYKEKTVSSLWKQFETQLPPFMKGLTKLMRDKKVTEENVSALLKTTAALQLGGTAKFDSALSRSDSPLTSSVYGGGDWHLFEVKNTGLPALASAEKIGEALARMAAQTPLLQGDVRIRQEARRIFDASKVKRSETRSVDPTSNLEQSIQAIRETLSPAEQTRVTDGAIASSLRSELDTLAANGDDSVLEDLTSISGTSEAMILRGTQTADLRAQRYALIREYLTDQSKLQEFISTAAHGFMLSHHLWQDPGTREDVLQQVHIKLWRQASEILGESFEARGTYDPAQGSPEAYLTRIIQNAVLDAQRKIFRQRTVNETDLQSRSGEGESVFDDNVLSSELNPADSTILKERADLLHVDYVGKLEPHERDVVALIYYSGFTEAEAARVLKVSPTSVHTWLQNAKTHLFRMLEGSDIARDYLEERGRAAQVMKSVELPGEISETEEARDNAMLKQLVEQLSGGKLFMEMLIAGKDLESIRKAEEAALGRPLSAESFKSKYVYKIRQMIVKSAKLSEDQRRALITAYGRKIIQATRAEMRLSLGENELAGGLEEVLAVLKADWAHIQSRGFFVFDMQKTLTARKAKATPEIIASLAWLLQQKIPIIIDSGNTEKEVQDQVISLLTGHLSSIQRASLIQNMMVVANSGTLLMGFDFAGAPIYFKNYQQHLAFPNDVPRILQEILGEVAQKKFFIPEYLESLNLPEEQALIEKEKILREWKEMYAKEEAKERGQGKNNVTFDLTALEGSDNFKPDIAAFPLPATEEGKGPRLTGPYIQTRAPVQMPNGELWPTALAITKFPPKLRPMILKWLDQELKKRLPPESSNLEGTAGGESTIDYHSKDANKAFGLMAAVKNWNRLFLIQIWRALKKGMWREAWNRLLNLFNPPRDLSAIYFHGDEITGDVAGNLTDALHPGNDLILPLELEGKPGVKVTDIAVTPHRPAKLNPEIAEKTYWVSNEASGQVEERATEFYLNRLQATIEGAARVEARTTAEEIAEPEEADRMIRGKSHEAALKKQLTWRTRDEAIENIRAKLQKFRPSIMERYTRVGELSAEDKKQLQREVYQITQAHLVLWGLSAAFKYKDFFEKGRASVMQAALPDLDLNPIGFELDLSSPEKVLESARFVLAEKWPEGYARYERLDSLSEAEIRQLRNEVYGISSGMISRWGMRNLVKYKSHGSYGKLLTAVFPKLQLQQIGFESDYSTQELGRETVRFALSREVPQLMQDYEKIGSLDEAGVQNLRNRIYAVTQGHFKVWGLGSAMSKKRAPYFNGSYKDILIDLFDNPKLALSQEGFEAYRRAHSLPKYSWKTREEGILNVLDGIGENRPDILENYNRYDELTEPEREGLRREIYKITSGHFNVWKIKGAQSLKTSPYFKGSHIEALLKVFPRLNLNPLEFGLNWTTRENAIASAKHVLSKNYPDIFKRYQKRNELSAPELKQLKKDVYTIRYADFLDIGLGGALGANAKEYFHGEHGQVLQAVFPSLDLNPLGFHLSWETPEEGRTSLRFALEREIPQVMEMYELVDVLADEELEDLRNAIYEISSARFRSWGLAGALGEKASYFKGSYIDALLQVLDHPKLALTREGFLGKQARQKSPDDARTEARPVDSSLQLQQISKEVEALQKEIRLLFVRTNPANLSQILRTIADLLLQLEKFPAQEEEKGRLKGQLFSVREKAELYLNDFYEERNARREASKRTRSEMRDVSEDEALPLPDDFVIQGFSPQMRQVVEGELVLWSPEVKKEDPYLFRPSDSNEIVEVKVANEQASLRKIFEKVKKENEEKFSTQVWAKVGQLVETTIQAQIPKRRIKSLVLLRRSVTSLRESSPEAAALIENILIPGVINRDHIIYLEPDHARYGIAQEHIQKQQLDRAMTKLYELFLNLPYGFNTSDKKIKAEEKQLSNVRLSVLSTGPDSVVTHIRKAAEKNESVVSALGKLNEKMKQLRDMMLKELRKIQASPDRAKREKFFLHQVEIFDEQISYVEALLANLNTYDYTHKYGDSPQKKDEIKQAERESLERNLAITEKYFPDNKKFDVEKFRNFALSEIEKGRPLEYVAAKYFHENFAEEIPEFLMRFYDILRYGDANESVEEKSLVVMASKIQNESQYNQMLSAFRNRGKVVGLAAPAQEEEFRLPHWFIFAKKRGIVAIPGIDMETAGVRYGDFKEGTPVVLDGVRGQMLLNPSARMKQHWLNLGDIYRYMDAYVLDRAKNPVLFNGKPFHYLYDETDLYAFRDQNGEGSKASAYGGLGVGLFRLEEILNEPGRAGIEGDRDRLALALAEILSQDFFKQQNPFIVRLFDVAEDKRPHFVADGKWDISKITENYTGVRFYLAPGEEYRPFRDFGKRQLQSIFQAATHADTPGAGLKILISDVQNAAEIEAMEILINEAKEEFFQTEAETQPGSNVEDLRARIQKIPIGYMFEHTQSVETERAAMFAKMRELQDSTGVERFVGIGSNDLTKSIIKTRRGGKGNIGKLDPHLVRDIWRIGEEGNKAGIPVTLEGEWGNSTEMMMVLLAFRLRGVEITPVAAMSRVPELLEMARIIQPEDFQTPFQKFVRVKGDLSGNFLDYIDKALSGDPALTPDEMAKAATHLADIALSRLSSSQEFNDFSEKMRGEMRESILPEGWTFSGPEDKDTAGMQALFQTAFQRKGITQSFFDRGKEKFQRVLRDQDGAVIAAYEVWLDKKTIRLAGETQNLKAASLTGFFTVDPRHRGGGVSGKFFDRIKKDLKERGFEILIGESTVEDPRAQTFWRRQGGVNSGYTLLLDEEGARTVEVEPSYRLRTKTYYRFLFDLRSENRAMTLGLGPGANEILVNGTVHSIEKPDALARALAVELVPLGIEPAGFASNKADGPYEVRFYVNPETDTILDTYASDGTYQDIGDALQAALQKVGTASQPDYTKGRVIPLGPLTVTTTNAAEFSRKLNLELAEQQIPMAARNINSQNVKLIHHGQVFTANSRSRESILDALTQALQAAGASVTRLETRYRADDPIVKVEFKIEADVEDGRQILERLAKLQNTDIVTVWDRVKRMEVQRAIFKQPLDTFDFEKYPDLRKDFLLLYLEKDAEVTFYLRPEIRAQNEMRDTRDLQKVLSAYSLRSPAFRKIPDRPNLWRVQSGNETYILKQPLFRKSRNIDWEASLLKQLGTELAAQIVQTKGSKNFVTGPDEEIYVLYQAVKGKERKWGGVEGPELEAAAKWLAGMHRETARMTGGPQLPQQRIGVVNREAGFKKLEDLKTQIEERGPPSKAERLFLKNFDLIQKNIRIARQNLKGSRLPQSVNHNDFHQGNFRFLRSGAIRVFDFEYAARDARIRDLASALTIRYQPDGSSLAFDKIETFVKAYHAENPLTPQEIKMLPEMFRLAMLEGVLLFAGTHGRKAGIEKVLNEQILNLQKLDQQPWESLQKTLRSEMRNVEQAFDYSGVRSETREDFTDSDVWIVGGASLTGASQAYGGLKVFNSIGVGGWTLHITQLGDDGRVIAVGPDKEVKGAQGRVYDNGLTIGRAEDNKLVLPTNKVSAHHLTLFFTATGAEFEDLGSTNGVYYTKDGKREHYKKAESPDPAPTIELEPLDTEKFLTANITSHTQKALELLPQDLTQTIAGFLESAPAMLLAGDFDPLKRNLRSAVNHLKSLNREDLTGVIQSTQTAVRNLEIIPKRVENRETDNMSELSRKFYQQDPQGKQVWQAYQARRQTYVEGAAQKVLGAVVEDPFEWNGKTVHLIAGAHGALKTAELLMEKAPSMLQDPEKWVFFYELANELNNPQVANALLDNRTARAIQEVFGITPVDFIPPGAAPEVIRRVSQKLKLPAEEILAADYFSVLNHLFSTPARTANHADLMVSYFLEARKGTHPVPLGVVGRKAIELAKNQALKAAFAQRMEQVKTEINIVRNDIAREKLLDYLAKHPEKTNILSVVGYRHSEVFGKPNRVPVRDPIFNSGHINLVLQNLVKTGLRLETRENRRTQITETLVQAREAFGDKKFTIKEMVALGRAKASGHLNQAGMWLWLTPETERGVLTYRFTDLGKEVAAEEARKEPAPKPRRVTDAQRDSHRKDPEDVIDIPKPLDLPPGADFEELFGPSETEDRLEMRAVTKKEMEEFVRRVNEAQQQLPGDFTRIQVGYIFKTLVEVRQYWARHGGLDDEINKMTIQTYRDRGFALGEGNYSGNLYTNYWVDPSSKNFRFSALLELITRSIDVRSNVYDQRDDDAAKRLLQKRAGQPVSKPAQVLSASQTAVWQTLIEDYLRLDVQRMEARPEMRVSPDLQSILARVDPMSRLSGLFLWLEQHKEDEQAVPLLLHLLHEENASIRRMAANYIAEYPGVVSAESMMEALSAPEVSLETFGPFSAPQWQESMARRNRRHALIFILGGIARGIVADAPAVDPSQAMRRQIREAVRQRLEAEAASWTPEQDRILWNEIQRNPQGVFGRNRRLGLFETFRLAVLRHAYFVSLPTSLERKQEKDPWVFTNLQYIYPASPKGVWSLRADSTPAAQKLYAPRPEARLDEIAQKGMYYPLEHLYSRSLEPFLDEYDRAHYEFIPNDRDPETGYWQRKQRKGMGEVPLVLGTWNDIEKMYDPKKFGRLGDNQSMKRHVVVRMKAADGKPVSSYFYDDHAFALPYALEAVERGEMPSRDIFHVFADEHEDNARVPQPRYPTTIPEALQLMKDDSPNGLRMGNFNSLWQPGFLSHHVHLYDRRVSNPTFRKRFTGEINAEKPLQSGTPVVSMDEALYAGFPIRPQKSQRNVFIDIDTDVTGGADSLAGPMGLPEQTLEFYTGLLEQIMVADQVLPATLHASTTKSAEARYGDVEIVRFIARIMSFYVAAAGRLSEEEIRTAVQEILAEHLDKIRTEMRPADKTPARPENRNAALTSIAEMIEQRSGFEPGQPLLFKKDAPARLGWKRQQLETVGIYPRKLREEEELRLQQDNSLTYLIKNWAPEADAALRVKIQGTRFQKPDDRGFEVSRIEFESPWRTKEEEAKTVHANFFNPRTGDKKPAVVVVSFSDTDGFARALPLHLSEKGAAVLEVVLPFYGPRAPLGTRELTSVMRYMRLDWGAAEFQNFILQGITDTLIAADWLRNQPGIDPDRISIAGHSVAANIAQTAYLLDPRFQNSILLTPIADFTHLMWSGQHAYEDYTLFLLNKRVSKENFSQALNPFAFQNTFENSEKGRVLFGIVPNDELVPAADNEFITEWAKTNGAVMTSNGEEGNAHLDGAMSLIAKMLPAMENWVLRNEMRPGGNGETEGPDRPPAGVSIMDLEGLVRLVRWMEGNSQMNYVTEQMRDPAPAPSMDWLIPAGAAYFHVSGFNTPVEGMPHKVAVFGPSNLRITEWPIRDFWPRVYGYRYLLEHIEKLPHMGVHGVAEWLNGELMQAGETLKEYHPDIPLEAMKVSVSGGSGEGVLFDLHLDFPDHPELEEKDFAGISESERPRFMEIFKLWYPFLMADHKIPIGPMDKDAKRREHLGQTHDPAFYREAALERLGEAAYFIIDNAEELSPEEIAEDVEGFFRLASEDFRNSGGVKRDLEPRWKDIGGDDYGMTVLVRHAKEVVEIVLAKHRLRVEQRESSGNLAGLVDFRESLGRPLKTLARYFEFDQIRLVPGSKKKELLSDFPMGSLYEGSSLEIETYQTEPIRANWGDRAAKGPAAFREFFTAPEHAKEIEFNLQIVTGTLRKNGRIIASAPIAIIPFAVSKTGPARKYFDLSSFWVPEDLLVNPNIQEKLEAWKAFAVFQQSLSDKVHTIANRDETVRTAAGFEKPNFALVDFDSLKKGRLKAIDIKVRDFLHPEPIKQPVQKYNNLDFGKNSQLLFLAPFVYSPANIYQNDADSDYAGKLQALAGSYGAKHPKTGVLDLGTGSGYAALVAAKEAVQQGSVAQVAAIDVSGFAAASAAVNFETAGINAVVYTGDGVDLELIKKILREGSIGLAISNAPFLKHQLVRELPSPEKLATGANSIADAYDGGTAGLHFWLHLPEILKYALDPQDGVSAIWNFSESITYDPAFGFFSQNLPATARYGQKAEASFLGMFRFESSAVMVYVGALSAIPAWAKTVMADWREIPYKNSTDRTLAQYIGQFPPRAKNTTLNTSVPEARQVERQTLDEFRLEMRLNETAPLDYVLSKFLSKDYLARVRLSGLDIQVIRPEGTLWLPGSVDRWLKVLSELTKNSKDAQPQTPKLEMKAEILPDGNFSLTLTNPGEINRENLLRAAETQTIYRFKENPAFLAVESVTAEVLTRRDREEPEDFNPQDPRVTKLTPEEIHALDLRSLLSIRGLTTKENSDFLGGQGVGFAIALDSTRNHFGGDLQVTSEKGQTSISIVTPVIKEDAVISRVPDWIQTLEKSVTASERIDAALMIQKIGIEKAAAYYQQATGKNMFEAVRAAINAWPYAEEKALLESVFFSQPADLPPSFLPEPREIAAMTAKSPAEVEAELKARGQQSRQDLEGRFDQLRLELRELPSPSPSTVETFWARRRLEIFGKWDSSVRPDLLLDQILQLIQRELAGEAFALPEETPATTEALLRNEVPHLFEQNSVSYIDLGSGSGTFIPKFDTVLKQAGISKIQGVGVDADELSAKGGQMEGRPVIFASVKDPASLKTQLEEYYTKQFGTPFTGKVDLIIFNAPDIHNINIQAWLETAKALLKPNGRILIRLHTYEGSKEAVQKRQAERDKFMPVLLGDKDLEVRELSGAPGDLPSARYDLGPLMIAKFSPVISEKTLAAAHAFLKDPKFLKDIFGSAVLEKNPVVMESRLPLSMQDAEAARQGLAEFGKATLLYTKDEDAQVHQFVKGHAGTIGTVLYDDSNRVTQNKLEQGGASPLVWVKTGTPFNLLPGDKIYEQGFEMEEMLIQQLAVELKLSPKEIFTLLKLYSVPGLLRDILPDVQDGFRRLSYGAVKQGLEALAAEWAQRLEARQTVEAAA